ncbi:hypothetical protein [Candidatus Cardinium sp. cByotN1]|uniref:hypothetical protein n=1 Tax=Candidatus Cardinium sp. cByotN1 TaxID=2699439 RepID=UPI001FB1E309|nr:hypothetical protein [Candidatus Cardinium sp. cByotN1]
MAHLLLLGQLLTSCGNPHYLRLGSWRTSSRTAPVCFTLCKVSCAAPSPIPLPQGSILYFYTKGSSCWAELRSDSKHPINLPVRFSDKFTTASLASSDPTWQAQYIHLHPASADSLTPSFIYIGESIQSPSTQKKPLLACSSATNLASGFTPPSASPICRYTFFKNPGYKIVLEPYGNSWQAMVHDNRFPGLSCSYSASVVFEKAYCLENFMTKDAAYQSDHIHLIATNKAKPMVYIGSFNLKGGGCCGKATWYCVFCHEPCPNACCESCCTHKNDPKHKTCRTIAEQQLQQERQNRHKLRCKQEEIEALTSNHKVLAEALMQEEASLKAYSQKKRAERTARSLALVEELAAQKQAIYHQSVLDKNKVLYNKFIANVALDVTLKESIEQETPITSTTESEEDSYYHLEIPLDQPTEAASPFSDDCPPPTIHPTLPLHVGFSPPASVSHYKQLPAFCASSESRLSSGDCQEDTDYLSEDSDFDGTFSMFSSSSLEDLSSLEPVSHPIPLRKSASLDNLLSAYSVKASLLSTPSPLTRLLTYYSLNLSPSAYLLFLRETGNLIQSAPPSIQKDFVDHLVNGGHLYPDIIKDYPSSEWLVRSLVQELIQDPSGKTDPITLAHFSNYWTNLSQRYTRDEQIVLLHALWKAKKSAELTLLQLTHILEIVSATGQAGYDMVCREQPDKLIQLKHYWLSDQVNSLPQFASSPEACSQLTDALAHTHLSPSFIPSLLSAIREEDDLTSLLEFLKLISKRKVPELMVSSIIYELSSPLAISKSKAYQWLTSLCCQLSLMHLSKIDANASDAIAPILYDRIKQDPTIAPSLEAFSYSRSDSIIQDPSTFIELLELVYNYQIQEGLTAAVFRQLAEEAPAEWIAKADQLITDKLFQAGKPYSVETLITEMVVSAPSMLYSSPAPEYSALSSHYLKKTAIEKVLTHQVVENLKPAIKDQLIAVINDYEEALAVLETRTRGLKEDIKKKEAKRSDLSTCFNIENQNYKNYLAELTAEEKALKIEIDTLIKENEENLKKSEEAVKKSEEKLGQKRAEDTATPPTIPTNQSKEPSKLAQLQDKLSSLSKTRSNVKTSYRVKKESYEASLAALLNQIKVLEVDLLKLEQNKEPIRSKIEGLSKEDATNFSDFILYKEVLDNFAKLKPTLRSAEHKPLDPYNPSALTRWSKAVKRKGSSLFNTHTISEIITGINQAATLSNNTGLTKSQHVDLLRVLFPFCQQSTIQRSKDLLVIIFLAAICALQNGQVSLVTDSIEWSISESAILSYLPLFEILDLTATKIDSTDPLSSSKSNIVYGKRSEFSALPRIMDYNLLQQKQQRIDHCYHSCLLPSADSSCATIIPTISPHSELVKGSAQWSDKHASLSVMPGAPVISALQSIDASILATLLRRATSAPITEHEVEAYYRDSIKADKEKEALKTLQEPTDHNQIIGFYSGVYCSFQYSSCSATYLFNGL